MPGRSAASLRAPVQTDTKVHVFRNATLLEQGGISGEARVVSYEQEVGRALVAHNRTLLAYVRRRLRSAVDAEDVVQEAMARVLSRARESVIADPLSYAMRAAKNILIDNGRATRSPVSLDDLEDGDTPVDGAATPLEALDMTERLRLFQATLEAMPRLRREVFIRRRVEEQAYDDIARDLKLSTEAVLKHYSRAALMLRRAVEARHAD